MVTYQQRRTPRRLVSAVVAICVASLLLCAPIVAYIVQRTFFSSDETTVYTEVEWEAYQSSFDSMVTSIGIGLGPLCSALAVLGAVTALSMVIWMPGKPLRRKKLLAPIAGVVAVTGSCAVYSGVLILETIIGLTRG